MRFTNLLETVRRDFAYGLRLLRANPGFATVAILSLALGIGANTAIFQLLDAVRLRSLPINKPEELVEVKIAQTSRTGSFTTRYPRLTYPIWDHVRQQQQAFSGLMAWSSRRFNLEPTGEARYAEGLFVSGDFFGVLGVSPSLGRVFSPPDDQRGCGAPGAVISHSFWQREFSGSRDALGKRLLLEGRAFEVIGVTPPGFFGVEVGRTFDVAIPLCAEGFLYGKESRIDQKKGWWLASFGRLKPGWSIEQTRAQLQSISEGIFRATLPDGYLPGDVKNYLAFTLTAEPAGSGVSRLRENFENPLWMLLAITGLVLLIACANLANLMLARASVRERELAVRLAIGASRRRLIRQLLAESLVIAALGAALGALLAQMLSRFLVSSLATGVNPLFVNLSPDWRVFGFIAGLAVFTCLLFGMAPALRATGTNPGNVLKAGGRGFAGNRGGSTLRRGLVISQVALSLVLLAGALLFVRSFINLVTLDAGFKRDGVLVANLDLQRVSSSPERLGLVQKGVMERVSALPEIRSAAQALIVPVSGSGWNDSILIDGVTAPTDRALISDFSRISPGYFRTLETPFVAGRDFGEVDSLSSPTVAIVNESFGRKFLNGASPLGRTLRVDMPPGEPRPQYEIVGVVKDTKYRDMRSDFQPIVFLPFSQQKEPDPYMNVIARSDVSLSALTTSIKRALADVDPSIGIEFRVLKTQIGESMLQERLMALLAGFFGILAGLLAMIGLYGVISYMVNSRKNEIGIRMALGAGRQSVIRLILREATLLLSVGLVVGVLLTVAAGRTASTMLFGLKPNDPLTIGAAAIALAFIGLLASYIPARRAATVDPMDVLRAE